MNNNSNNYYYHLFIFAAGYPANSFKRRPILRLRGYFIPGLCTDHRDSGMRARVYG